MHNRHISIWKEAPFFRLIIPFAMGIITEKYFQFRIEVLIPPIVCLAICWIILFSLPLQLQFSLRAAYGLLINIAILFTGIVLARMNDVSLSAKSFAKVYQPEDVLVVKLLEPKSETRATYKTKAAVYGICRDDSCFSVTGILLLYFRKDSLAARLNDGNQLLIFAKASSIINSGNPGSFDFASYAKLQGILMQSFVAPDQYRIIADVKRNGLKAWLDDSRTAICAILKKYIRGQKESALAEALLVGYKEDLDKELLQAYSNTGVVHVIAISGLHLGILYVIFKSILTIIPFFRNSKWLTAVIIIIFLWLFSLLTGGSPSVIRSAVMFTAILCGESFSRKISIYNCLAASAFILLTYKPYWIFDIGFQLSYSAVLGILVFNKAIEQLLFIKNKSLDKLWQMVAVTLAAQILTTPISLFYFKQFPNYFLLANIIAVPVSSAILVGTIILCMIFFVHDVAELAGSMLSFSIRFMNATVEHINSLPFSVTAGIHISLLQVLLLYLMIIAASMYLHRNKKIFLFTTQLILVALAFTNLYRQLKISGTQLLIVYNLKGKQLIEITDGKKGMIMGADKNCMNKDCSPVIQAANTEYGIRNMELKSLPAYIKAKKTSVSFITSKEDILHAHPTSIAIPSSKITGQAETICRLLRPKLIVLDASHNNSSIKRWSSVAHKHHINIHSVSTNGAFVKTLN